MNRLGFAFAQQTEHFVAVWVVTEPEFCSKVFLLVFEMPEKLELLCMPLHLLSIFNLFRDSATNTGLFVSGV